MKLDIYTNSFCNNRTVLESFTLTELIFSQFSYISETSITEFNVPLNKGVDNFNGNKVSF